MLYNMVYGEINFVCQGMYIGFSYVIRINFSLILFVTQLLHVIIITGKT